MDEILTPKMVAEYLHISKSKVYYLLRRGVIPSFRIFRNVRIRKSDLMDWIDSLCA